MTEQVNNSKQTLHTLPENIRKSLEEYYEPITSAYYCGELDIENGGKILRLPTFAVNKTHYVYVHDAENALYQYEAIAMRQERQKNLAKMFVG